MPQIEINTLNRKIDETQAIIAELTEIENESLRMIMSSELKVRLESLARDKAALETAQTKEKVSLRIYGDRIEPGRISGRVLLDVLSGFQQMLDSVANAMFHSPTARGKIPNKIKNMTSFDIVGTFAGSFGLDLEYSKDQCGIDSETFELNRILNGMFSVLETTDNGEMLMEAIAPFGKRSVTRYREWLNDLNENDVNLELNWLDNTAIKRNLHIKKEKSSQIISVLDTIEKIDQEEIAIIGKLNGINIRKLTFEISVDDIGIVKGTSKMERLISLTDKIGSVINVNLIKSTTYSKTGIQKHSWYLE